MHLSKDVHALVEVVCRVNGVGLLDHIGSEVDLPVFVLKTEIVELTGEREIFAFIVSGEQLPWQHKVLRRHWELMVVLSCEC
jgi:hypothetical protein